MFVGLMGINNHFRGQKRQQKFALQMYFMATMWHLDEHQHSVSILSSVYKIMSDIWANNSAPENPTFLKLGQVIYQYSTIAHSLGIRHSIHLTLDFNCMTVKTTNRC